MLHGSAPLSASSARRGHLHDHDVADALPHQPGTGCDGCRDPSGKPSCTLRDEPKAPRVSTSKQSENGVAGRTDTIDLHSSRPPYSATVDAAPRAVMCSPASQSGPGGAIRGSSRLGLALSTGLVNVDVRGSAATNRLFLLSILASASAAMKRFPLPCAAQAALRRTEPDHVLHFDSHFHRRAMAVQK